MNRIDRNTVEFTSPAEVKAHNLFDEALGHPLCLDIINAARHAIEAVVAEHKGLDRALSASFVEYLSEGTLRLTGGRKVVLTPKGRAIALASI